MHHPSGAQLAWLSIWALSACEFADPDQGAGSLQANPPAMASRDSGGVVATGDSGAAQAGGRPASGGVGGTSAPVDADAGERVDAGQTGDIDGGVNKPPTGEYPAGPYGFAEGDTVIDAAFKDADGATVRLSDLRAKPGVKVIVWSSGAEWCGVCRIQAPKLEGLHTMRSDEGLLVMESLHEDVSSNPADAATLQRWKADLGVTYLLLVEKSPNYADHFSNPLELVIDAATMKIRYRQVHATSDLDLHIDAALAQAGP